MTPSDRRGPSRPARRRRLARRHRHAPRFEGLEERTLLDGDSFEPNDSRAAATLLNVKTGAHYFDKRSIHVPSDVDWYRFHTQGPGQDGNFAQVSFSQGSIGLALYDSNGGLLARNDSGTSGEEVSFDGRPAGEYYIQVYALEDATCPDYTLQFNVPGADYLEPNDSRATAHDLGALAGHRASPYLSIDHAGDEDWFRFATTGLSGPDQAVAISYKLAQGDLELQLYDSAGKLLSSATGAHDDERISLGGQPAGTYYARVFGAGGATNAIYSLTIDTPGPDWQEPNDTFAAARDMGAVNPNTGGWYYIGDLSIDKPTDVDWFKFTTLHPALPGNFARIEGLDDLSVDLDLALFDSAGNPLASAETAEEIEQISLGGLAAGTYYARVTGFNGATRPKYKISVNFPGPDNQEPNDTAATAYDFGTTNTTYTGWLHLSIDKPTDVDWFKFTTIQAGVPGTYVGIDFSLAGGDLDMELYDSALKKLDSATGAHDGERISLAGRPAGTYYAKVFGASGAANGDFNIGIYPPSPDLSEPNDSRVFAHDFGAIQGHWQFHNLSIDSSDDVDWFRFETVAHAEPGNVLKVAFQNKFGNLDVALYNAAGTLITSARGQDDGETIDLAGLAAGVYYVQVFGAANPRYDFDLYSPWRPGNDKFEPNNTRATATDLRRPQGETTRRALAIGEGDADWFRFETIAPSVQGQSVRIDFDHRDGALRLELYDAAGTKLETSADPASDREQIGLAGRPAGVYYVRVVGVEEETNPVYDLTLLTPRRLVPDWAEVNNDDAHVYDLKTVQGLESWPSLSIDHAGDADWFAFALAAAGTERDFVALAFNHAVGSLTAALYDAAGKPLNQASGPGDRLAIPLRGLAAGRYKLKVTGADAATVNPSYTLTVQAPPAPKADAFEPNETRSTAAALGTINGSKSWSDLSINVVGDSDWFRFTTTDTGTSDESVQLVYDPTRGFPMVELYDAAGQLLERANPAVAAAVVTNAKLNGRLWTPGVSPYWFLEAARISLRARPAGTYFVRVAAAYSAGLVPAYNLMINAPPVLTSDWAGANHSRQSAYDLGRVEGSKDWSKLSIDTAGQDDWFQFQLPQDGLDGNSASIAFSRTRADLDLNLYDSTGALVATSAGTGGAETVSLKGLKAGTYFLQVAGFHGSTSPAYTITIKAPGGAGGDVFEPNNTRSTAFDFGPLQGQTDWGGGGTTLAIADGSDADWFSFQLVQTGQPSNFVRIQSDSTKGDLDLELFDSAGNRIATSAGLRDAEQISLNGRLSGRYYVRIFGYNGGSNPGYTLSINAPGKDRAEPNDSRATAFDLRQVQGSKTWDGFSIDPADDQDWYRFELVVPGAAGNTVTASDTNRVGLSLSLFDAAGQPLVSSGELSDTASVSLVGLGIGTYYVRVAAEKGRSTAYTLVIDAPTGLAGDWAESHDGITDNNTRAHASDLKLIEGRVRWDDPDHPLTIDHAGDEDWFRFQLATQGLAGNSARIDSALSAGDLDLELYDASGKLLARSAHASNAEQVGLAGLAAGTYYLRVVGLNGATSPRYTLTIDAPNTARGDRDEPNDTRATATDLRIVSGGLARQGLSIHRAGDTDWFRFQTELPGLSGHFVTLSFAQTQGDLDLRLYDGQGTLLRTSAGVDDGERISLAGLPAGTYFVQVAEADTRTNPEYALTFFAPGKASGDWAEPNGSRAAAKDLRQVSGIQQWTGLSVHQAGDDDWFRFELVGPGVDGNQVGVEHDVTNGQLDLTLYDANGTQLDQVGDATDFQVLRLAGRAAGTYYVRVSGHNGATSPNYSLWVNAPAAPGSGIFSDWAEPNDQLAAPRDLGQVKGSRTWDQLSIDTAGNDDWFRFTTIGNGADGQYARIDSKLAQGKLGLALLKADGTPLVTSQAESDRQQVSLAGLPAGNYLVRVFGVNSATNPRYSLTINAPATPERDWAEAHAGLADNDTRARAFDLREINGGLNVTELSIHPAGDVDWYRFATLANSADGRYVRIDFDHSQGALALELYDASGQNLATSAGAGDFQQITLAGRARGTYYVRVAGQGSATSPLYALTIAAPPVPVAGEDWSEYHDGQTNNDSIVTAYSLRDLQALQTGKTASARPTYNYPLTGFVYDRIDSGKNIFSTGVNVAEANTAAVPYNRVYQAAANKNPGLRFLHQATPEYALDFAFNPPPISDPTQANYAAMLQHETFDSPLNRTPSDSITSLFYGITAIDDPATTPLDTRQQDLINQKLALGLQLQAQQRRQAAQLQGVLAVLTIDAILKSKPTTPSSGSSSSGSSSSSSSDTSSSRPSPSNPPKPLDTTTTALLVVMAWWFSQGKDGGTPPVVLGGLQIDGPDDTDVFGFQLATDGQAGQSVRIDFDPTLGALALELLDATGTTLDRADAPGGVEQLSLAGLPAGTYYVRIGGATNLYTLSLFTPALPDPAGDWSEPSETKATARDLGTIEGTTSLAGLSIHTATDADWFRFTTVAGALSGDAGTIVLKSDPAAGDLDIELYDAAGTTPLARSKGRSSSETVSIGNRGAGTYYVRVAGYAGATNAQYSLSFRTPERTLPPDAIEPNNSREAAVDLNSYNGSATLSGLTITPGDHDYFRFDAGSASTYNYIEIEHNDRAGELKLEVLDQNGNRVRPSSGVPGFSANLAGLPAGRYYLHVFGAAASVANRYALVFSAPTPQASPADWTVMVYMTASDLAPFAFQDINEMEDAATRLPGSVHLAVLWDQSARGPTYATGRGAQPAWDTVGRAIIQPDTDTETIATSFDVYIHEQNTGDPDTLKVFIDWAKVAAPARHYALIFWDHGQGIRGVNFDNADNQPAGWLTVPEIAQALVDSKTHFDAVAFDACKMAMTEVTYGLRSAADVIVGSEEIEGGSGYNYRTAFAPLQSNPGSVDAKALASGWVQSYQAQYQDDPRGADTQSAVLATNLDSLASWLRDLTYSVGQYATARDWPLLVEAREAAVAFANSSDYRDLGQFLQAIVDRPAITAAIRNAASNALSRLTETIIARSAGRRRTSGLSIALPAPGSTISAAYLADAKPFLDRSGWGDFLTRFVNQPKSTEAGSDWSEANDLRARAYNLHRLGGSANSYSGLSLHTPSDVDWFRFFIPAAGASGNGVAVSSSVGSLRVFVEDANGQRLAGSGGMSVSLANAPAGEYYVRVEGYGSTTVRSYMLNINAPGTTVPASDWARGNDQPDKAQDLGVIASTALFSGLALQDARSDWFQFATPRNPQEFPGRLVIRSSTASPVSARLLAADGTTINAESFGNAAWLAYPSGSGATYRMEVSGPAQGYTLNFTEESPLLRVVASGVELADQTGAIDFGQASVGTSLVQTILIRNDGSTPLHVTGPVPLPAGFVLAAGLGSATVFPGEQTSFAIRFEPALVGPSAGAVSLNTDDPNHPAFMFNVVARAVPPPDATPPTVLNVATMLDRRKNLTGVRITFSESMNPLAAGSKSSYRIFSPAPGRRSGNKNGKATPLRSAVYDPSTNTVTLRLRRKVALSQPLRFLITAAAGLTDLAGNQLDGDRNHAPGGDFVATLTKRGVRSLFARRFGRSPLHARSS